MTPGPDTLPEVAQFPRSLRQAGFQEIGEILTVGFLGDDLQ